MSDIFGINWIVDVGISYRLYGVVNYLGFIFICGYFFVDIFDLEVNWWFRCDDLLVIDVSFFVYLYIFVYLVFGE